MTNLPIILKRANICGFTALRQLRVFLAVPTGDGKLASEISQEVDLLCCQVNGILRTLSDWGLVDLHKGKVTIDGIVFSRFYAALSASGCAAREIILGEVGP